MNSEEEGFLVITRRERQSIILKVKDETVKIFVTKVKGNQARIGFKASRDVEIHRGEVFLELDKKE